LPSAVGIVQARTLSTRLPGKVLLPLTKRLSILEIIHGRIVNTGIEWWLATSDHASDDRLADLARHLGFSVFRGDTLDVLSRYETIVSRLSCDFVVKVNGDNPTVHSEGISLMLSEAEEFLDNKAMLADYGNRRRYPQGHLPQILRREVFQNIRGFIASAGGQNFHATHVTSILLKDLAKSTEIDVGPPAAHLRWTVDTLEDMRAVSAIFETLDCSPFAARYVDLLDSVRKEPAKAAANGLVRQKEIPEG